MDVQLDEAEDVLNRTNRDLNIALGFIGDGRVDRCREVLNTMRQAFTALGFNDPEGESHEEHTNR